MISLKERLSGVFAPMCTPFENDEIIYDGLIENVQKMNATGLRGYFVLGTNGEYKSLGTEERYKVLEMVADNSTEGKVVMAGCGAESTRETIYLAKRAADSGAEMVSILMPHFFAKKIDADTMVQYTIQVANGSPVPVLLYNNPSVAAGITITPDVINRVKDHPNVLGIKDSSKNTWQENLGASNGDFYALAGSANYFFDLLEKGGTGGVLSLANVFPEECAAFYNAYINGDNEEAVKLNNRLMKLNKEVSGAFGVAGVKAAMDLVGYCGGAPRLPLKPVTDEQKAELAKTLESYGFSLAG